MAAEVVIDIVGKDNFSSTLGNFGNIMTGIKSAIDLAGDAFRAFTGFASEGLDAIAGYERMSASLTSLSASQLLQAGAVDSMAEAMDLAAPKAEILLGWIQEIAIKSPFTAEGVAQAFRMAQAYGFSAEEAQRLTVAMIDFAAGSGASEYAMQQIARALGQISATGKLTGGDMLQLVNAGLPVAQILADAFGVTTAEIMAMREKGLIPAKDAIEAITVYLETNFKGAAENQANTWAGLQGTFADLKTMGLREFFGGLFEALQPLAVTLAEFLQGPGMELIKFLGDGLGAITTQALDPLNDLIRGLETFHQWMDAGYTVAEALEGTLHLLANGDGPIATLAGIIYDMVPDFQVLVNAWNGFNFALQTTGDPLEAVMQGLLRLAAGDGLLSELARWLLDIQSTFHFDGFLQGLVTIFDDLDSVLADLVSSVDWEEVGTNLGEAISEIFGISIGEIESRDSELGPALSRAIVALFKGLDLSGLDEVFAEWSVRIGQGIDRGFAEWSQNAGQGLDETFANWSQKVGHAIDLAVVRISQSIGEGLKNALNTIYLGIPEWVESHIINPIKRALGIASPSSVFMQIGRDIVQGLMNGISFMGNSLVTVFEGIIERILQLPGFRQVAEFLGVELGGSSSTGELGGRSTGTAPGSPTGTTTTSTGTAGSVVNNFYGTVNFGDMGQLGYDCPSPHPLMAASANSVLNLNVG
jgi:tape measure domain-containing protein